MGDRLLRDLVGEWVSDPGKVNSLTAAEIIQAFERGYPEDRRSRLSSEAYSTVEVPALDLRQIEWKNDAFHPKNVAEVQQLVATARSRGRRLRVAGARHSVPGAVYSTDHHDVRVVLDGDLRHVEFLSHDDQTATVLVGGGCYLGVNPADPDSTCANSLNGILDGRGYALPVLGGISHQTVAGFLQTSSAGGSLAHTFHDSIQAIELVDGTGTVRWLPIGTDAFDAAGVAVGLLGVVTHVLLTVRPRYFVRGTEQNFEERHSLLLKTNGRYALQDALSSSEYLHLDWFPQQLVGRVTQWEGARGPEVDPPDPYVSTLKDTWMNVVAAAVLALTGGLLALDPRSRIVQEIVGALLRKFLPLDETNTFNDRWLTVLPSDDQVHVDTLIRLIMTEVWLPLDQLTTAIDRLKAILVEEEVASNFAVELYGARRSPFWLSPSFDRDVLRVDVFWWAYNLGDPRKHFGFFWDALLDLDGARLHWGKQLPEVGRKCGNIVFNPAFLKARYDRFDDWLAIRADMDPDAVFLTSYWKSILGL